MTCVPEGHGRTGPRHVETQRERVPFTVVQLATRVGNDLVLETVSSIHRHGLRVRTNKGSDEEARNFIEQGKGYRDTYMLENGKVQR